MHELKSLNNQPKVDGELAQVIEKTILSKKFRKYAVDDDFRKHLTRIINESIASNSPINFVWDFGGYKLWRLEETPEVDWAELFSLIYFAKWLMPIAANFGAGINFDFFSEDVFVPQINNIAKEDIEKYIKSFRNLVEFVNSYLPNNFRFSLSRLIEQYESADQFENEYHHNLEKLKSELPNGLPILTPQQAATVELNVKPKEGQTTDGQWREKVQLVHDAYSLASKRRPYYRNEEKILVNNLPAKCAIATGTAKTSVVKFWVGAGLLKPHDGSYIEYIMTPKQLESVDYETIPIKVEGLTGKNFERIKVF